MRIPSGSFVSINGDNGEVHVYSEVQLYTVSGVSFVLALHKQCYWGIMPVCSASTKLTQIHCSVALLNILLHYLNLLGLHKVTKVDLNPGETNDTITRNWPQTHQIAQSSKRCIFMIVQYSRITFNTFTKQSCAYRSRKIDIQIQVRGKISRAQVQNPAKSYFDLNIFGTMNQKLNHFWTSVDTGPLCKYAKCDCIILQNQGDTAF